MKKRLFGLSFIVLLCIFILSGCKEKKNKNDQSVVQTSTSEKSEDLTVAAPDMPEQYATGICVNEEYAKTHDGYYLKTADGSLYPLTGSLKDITIQSDTFGVPYTSADKEDGSFGTDLYWNISGLFGGYVIMSCGEVPVPMVTQGEDYSVRLYTSTNYDINNLPKLEVRDAPSPSPCTPFSLLYSYTLDWRVPAYGVYGKGRHYIAQADGKPYFNTPFTLEDTEGNVMGSFFLDPDKMTTKDYIQVEGSPFDDLWPWEKYKWSWYEGSAYQEVELQANCALYVSRSDEPYYIDAQLTKEGYYEYNIKEELTDGAYIINDFVIWILDQGWDPFEEAGIEKDNPTFYDYAWQH